jgi:tRNA pseudouridine-54 N-methylase
MTRHITKEMDSELMVYDTEEDSVHVLNSTARMVYHLHQNGRNSVEMEQEMRNHFQVDSAHDLSDDVARCLEELRDKQLIDL